MMTNMSSKGELIFIYICLMILLALTWGLSFIDFGVFSLSISLTISFVKTLLVLLFFMELKKSQRLVNLFACTGFFWLAIMVVLILADYLTRSGIT